MRKYVLEAVVFLCGATVMIYELVGSRVLAPYLGTSLIVWTSLIGVILGSLSAGYWYGGRISDRKTDPATFAYIIFIAGILIGLTTFIYYDLLFAIDRALSSLIVKSLASMLILFALPSVLLGMVSPYAVKLKMRDLGTMGRTVGNLYALSSLGSIAGTFLAGFYLIPTFGTNRILLILATVLTLCSLACLPRHVVKEKIALLVVFGAFMALGGYGNRRLAVQDYIFDVDTQYSRVQICDDTISLRTASSFFHSSVVRSMRISGSYSSAMLMNDPDLHLKYTRYFRLARHFKPGLHKSLMIGGAGYSYPKDYLTKYRNAYLDVVEIDPMVTELARTYFNLKDDKRLKIIHEDGRTFINKSENKYDAVFNDAFSSPYSIPYQLTTVEAARKISGMLSEDGVVLINIISSLEGPAGTFLRAEYKTFKSIFPQVYLFPVDSEVDGEAVQNVMLIALKSNKKPLLKSRDPELNGYLGHFWRKGVADDMPVLSDDYAPVDYYISKTLTKT